MNTDLSQTYFDTQIVTCFRFLDQPDSFIPDSVQKMHFVITTPVVYELERIKDEHFSKSQRERARRCLDLLTGAEEPNGVTLTKRSQLHFKWPEPTRHAVDLMQLRVDSPDGRFTAAIHWSTQFSTNRFYVLSDDVGVRVRAKHMLLNSVVRKPDDALRFPSESYNLPQLVKATVRELARELAAEMREGDRGPIVKVEPPA